MRLPQHQDANRGRFEVEMTPMIDVVFLLLIYFVCTASFQPLEQALRTPLAVPTGGVSAQPVEVEIDDFEPIVVRAQANDAGQVSWLIGEAACANLAQVQATLAALFEIHSELPIILDIDGQVPLADVVGLYDACWLAGYRKIQFATSVPVQPEAAVP